MSKEWMRRPLYLLVPRVGLEVMKISEGSEFITILHYSSVAINLEPILWITSIISVALFAQTRTPCSHPNTFIRTSVSSFIDHAQYFLHRWLPLMSHDMI
jgi:hypothetical protein